MANSSSHAHLNTEGIILDTVSTGSGSDLVNDESQLSLGYRMLITDQVAPDCVQARRPTFQAKPLLTK